jgi:hypothetical protein
MTSEKQIAANRRNAKRSTGPKTTAGKLRSSQNAYRHGLSLPLPHHPQMPMVLEMIAQSSSDPMGGMTESSEMVHAIFDLARIRGVRRTMLSVLESECNDPALLRRLMALDRYEWRALAKRRRAENEL